MLEHLLDVCLAELNGGEDLERVLANHPEHADELRPMLAAACWMTMDIPAPTRRNEGKAAFMQTVAQRRRQVEQTDGYVVELKAGVPLDQLVGRATPGMRPLLLAAWRMFTAEIPEPNADRRAAGKARVMALAAARQRARHSAVLSLPFSRVYGHLAALAGGFAASSRLARRASSGVAALALVATLMGGGLVGVTRAAASSLPGQPLYGVKRLGESARLLLTRDAGARAELEAEFGSTRLAEIANLAATGQDLSVAAFVEWLESDTQALTEVRALPAQEQDALAEAILALSGGHASALALAVHDVRELEVLVAWSEQRIAAAKRSGEGVSVDIDPVTGQLQLHTDRLLPAEDLLPGAKLAVPAPAKSSESQVVPVPDASLPVNQPIVTGPGAAEVIQAGESGDNEDRDRRSPAVDQPGPAGEAPTQPPFGQPGGDQPIPPTDEPPLAPPPGGSGETQPPSNEP